MVGLRVFFCLAVWSVLAFQASAQRYFIIAPNVIRVDVNETILINLEGIPPEAVIPVTLYFQVTGSEERLSETTVIVDSADLSHVATMRIARAHLPKQKITTKYITLVAQSSAAQISFNDRQSILLSFKSGFVFIQTDKPLYTPSQRVDIRIIALDQNMLSDSNPLRVDISGPDGIIVQRAEKRIQDGFAMLEFDFPPAPVFGDWMVKVHYGHLFEANTFIQFELKDYAQLPNFQVEVHTQEQYILPETERIVTQVTAKYAFGKQVFGQFFLRYGVFTDDGDLLTLQEKEGTLQEGGIGYEVLTVSDIMVDMDALMGKRLIIQAFVTDAATGETINTNNTRVTFTRTPYRFNWEKTPRFFKKGLPFTVKATVQYINGLPAYNVPVALSAVSRLSDGTQFRLEGAWEYSGQQDSVIRNSGPDGEIFFRVDIHREAVEVILDLETRDMALIQSNVESSFTVRPEESVSGEFLLVRNPSEETQQIGSFSSLEVLLSHHENAETLHFFVISGGIVVLKGERQIYNANTHVEIRITHQMAPVSRVVAYYINNNGHVIADALLIQVEKKCENPISVSFKGLERTGDTFKTNGYQRSFMIRVGAKATTRIGLLAMDEAVYAMGKKRRLTQKKVFERMAGYDLGCGPGGGQTAAKVFKDAGVTVMTNANLYVAHREEIECPQAQERSKRSSDKELGQILDEFERDDGECCGMGLRDVTRRDQLPFRSPRGEASSDCCDRKTRSIQGRSSANDDLDLENTIVRTNFPESWMFFDMGTYEENDHVSRHFSLPDSVTTWVVEAVGVSSEYKMCVAEPVKLQVQPLFFLELGLPDSVKRMEQIEIIVSVFNYADEELTVTVYLRGAEGLCFEAQPGRFSKGKTLYVLPEQPASVKFVVVPLEAKKIPIEVYAVTKPSGSYRDAIRRFLDVHPGGYRQQDTVTIKLSPANPYDSPARHQEAHGGQNQSHEHIQTWDADSDRQIDVIRYFLRSDAIPGTHNVHVSLQGNYFGRFIDTVIGGLENLLRIPTGSGENTSQYLGPNVYIYRYLKHIGQFTAELETSAQKYIGDVINRMFTFRKPDGSFAAYHGYSASTWLTAYVSKVFCQAQEFVYIDEQIMCNAMQWLLDATQNADGSFQEVFQVHDESISGGVHGSTSLTAYVLISLLECECSTMDKTDSVARATAFLEQQLPALTRPYDIAITAYALTLVNSIRADEALTMLKNIAAYDGVSNSRYWAADDSSFGAGPKPYWYRRPTVIEVETTSYALLALLGVDDLTYSHAVVNWLTEQENYAGGFMSTQGTVIALQALSEYSIKAEINRADIICHVICQKAYFEQEFLLTDDNANVRQSAVIHLPDHQPEFHVSLDCSGTGTGLLKLEYSYNIPQPNSEMCYFVLNVSQDFEAITDGPFIRYNIEVRYLESEATGMAIVVVGIHTGFRPMTEDLDQVKLDSGGNINLIEQTDQSVIFYLDEIREDRVEMITFRSIRVVNLGKLDPVAVKVYDYYNPTIECSKFINPAEQGAHLSTLCEGDTCVCAAGRCGQEPRVQLADFDISSLKQRACKSEFHFAFKVEVVSRKRQGNFQYYIMSIHYPIKYGEQYVETGENRTFWRSSSCYSPNLVKRKNYLVIGSGDSKIRNDAGHYSYIIDERMFFYEWPTGSKLGSRKWQQVHRRLEELKRDLVINGCE